MDRSALPVSTAVMWHICWQAALGRNLVVDASLAERIRDRLIDAHRKNGRVLVDYLLATTEIHLLVKLSIEESPEDVARAIANIVARWIRQVQGVRGPVFAERYQAHCIASDEALRDEIRMLAWRPVTLGACTTPSQYRYSALRTTLGLRPAMGFDARPVLALFGEPVPVARRALRARLAKRPTALELRHWELLHGLTLASKADAPQPVSRVNRGVAAKLVAACGPDGIAGALRLLERWVGVRLNMHEPVLLADVTGAAGARARALVACLAVDMALCPAIAVARHFGRSKATLSEQMAACRNRAADQPILQTPLTWIVDEAVALAASSK